MTLKSLGLYILYLIAARWALQRFGLLSPPTNVYEWIAMIVGVSVGTFIVWAVYRWVRNRRAIAE